MNAPAPHFQLTAPPFETFPDEPRDTVQAAFDWLITERRADRLLETGPARAEDSQAFLDRYTEVLTRVGNDAVVAWLAISHASTLIAEKVGVAAEGFWELPRDVFPPEDDLEKAAAAQLRMFLDESVLRKQIGFFCTATLGRLKETAENTLNSVCSGHCPPPPGRLDRVDRVWVLRALVSVLLSLHVEKRNVMRGVAQCGRYAGPGTPPAGREGGS